MAIHVNNCEITNCGVGISVPADTKLYVNGTRFSECRKAIDLRDPPSLIDRLGLKNDTPPALVAQVLHVLEASRNVSHQQKIEIVQKSGIVDWLAAGANLTTVAQGLITLRDEGLVPAAIKVLLGS